MRPHTSSRKREQGFTLVELLVALLILAVAMGGITIILIMAMETNNKAGNDTTSTMVAEHVMEQISEPANPGSVIQLVDCQGVAHTINITGAALGTVPNGGAGANLTAPTAITPEVIDWTQAYLTVPLGYRMRYRSCGPGVGLTGQGADFDVRWNITTLTPYTRLVVVSARPVQDTQTGNNIAGGLRFVVPVNLRTIAGVN